MRKLFQKNRKVTIIAALITAIFVLMTVGRSIYQARAAQTNVAVVTVSAASFLGPLAPGEIATAFGANLATQQASAQSLPLPLELAGTTVRLIDSQNVEHRAPLFFVSAGQVNYLIPEEAALGAVRVIITNSNNSVSQGQMEVANSSPAIFTVALNGIGVPVALTTFDGSFFENVANPDGTPRPVKLGMPWQPNILTLFGTGLRRATDLRVRFGNTEVAPLFSGAQGVFAGLDQINVAIPSNLSNGVIDISLVAEGRVSNIVQILIQDSVPSSPAALSVGDVQTIIAQGVAKAQQVGLNVTIAVVDKEGNVLGVFKMNGARNDVLLGATNLQNGQSSKVFDPDGLERVVLPLPNAPPPFNEGAALAAISKAGTAAFFSTQGSAVSTRTASFIIQEHFPPGIPNLPGGPLFGVQFSQLPCTDVKVPSLTLGLAGDPGGVPIYKNGVSAGAVGIEGDGFYSVDIDPSDQDQSTEEIIAVAATLGYEAPSNLRIDRVLVDGIRLPYLNATQTGGGNPPPFDSLPGTVIPAFPIRGTQPSAFTPLTLGGVAGRVVAQRFFPFKDGAVFNGNNLTADEVNRIISQAAAQANRTRAAIRLPAGIAAEVNITVVDTNGTVLGIFSTADAPMFGFDVSAQKARTAAFFSHPTAGAQLRAAEGGRFAKFVDAAAADGIRLDGSIAFSDRAQGFLSRPFFPDGIDSAPNGPFSKPIQVWSPFNDGLQIALARTALATILTGNPVSSCTPIPGLPNGLQIFAGSVPLYKNGVLVGAVGISGDGIDQDDIIAASGSIGFEAPENIRADQMFVRGVRLPYVKFPRNPNIP